jgi:hypothetical protein
MADVPAEAAEYEAKLQSDWKPFLESIAGYSLADRVLVCKPPGDPPAESEDQEKIESYIKENLNSWVCLPKDSFKVSGSEALELINFLHEVQRNPTNAFFKKVNICGVQYETKPCQLSAYWDKILTASSSKSGHKLICCVPYLDAVRERRVMVMLAVDEHGKTLDKLCTGFLDFMEAVEWQL